MRSVEVAGHQAAAEGHSRRGRCLITYHRPGAPRSFIRFDTQFDNAGDCLINRELVRLLATRGSVCLDLSACPKLFADEILTGLPPDVCRRWSPWPFVLELLAARVRGRRCYWFLMPGGISGRPRAGAIGLWIRDQLLTITALLGVRICQVGASFGDLSAVHLAVWRRRRRWLYRLFPRDSISADYLRGHGIHSDGCIPDLAFNMFATPSASSRPAAGRGVARVGGLSFRTDQYSQQADDVADVLKSLSRCGGDSTMVWRPIIQVARDRHGMQRLQQHVQSEGLVVEQPVDRHDDVEACLRFYQGLSLVVSNRLHVLLMAASQGGRILALVGGPGGAKLEGILRDLGLEHAIIRSGWTPVGNELPAGGQLNGEEQRRTLHRAFDELLEITSTRSTTWP
jgi:polysaccharide pyruvyl transferase WcaK-like protein